MSLPRYLSEVGEQDAREERAAQVEENPRLDAIVAAYELWLPKEASSLSGAASYSRALGLVRALECPAADVYTFSSVLPQYVDRPCFGWTPLFLSALVNAGRDEEYQVVTEHLDSRRLNYFGYANCKRLTVQGEVGYGAGYGMCTGVLTVQGDAGHGAGAEMTGGVLRLEGDVGSISDIWRGGRIYHRGLLIRGEEP